MTVMSSVTVMKIYDFQIAVPQAPLTFPSTVPIPERLQRIQKYMSGLEYPFGDTADTFLFISLPLCFLKRCLHIFVLVS